MCKISTEHKDECSAGNLHRRVSFKDVPPEVHELPFYGNELRVRWYSPGDYFLIKQEALDVVRQMSRASVHESNLVSTRGLEIINRKQVLQRKQSIDNVVHCILKEQRRKGSNPDSLRELYKQLSNDHITASIKSAAADAVDAERILAVTKKSEQRGRRLASRVTRGMLSMLGRFASSRGIITAGDKDPQ